MSDILANIKIMFTNIKPCHLKVRMTHSMGEIASDGQLCYLPATDEIAGLCKHTAAELPSWKMRTDLTIICAVRHAVCEGKIHVGQEVFVAAFAWNDKYNYGARPVLLIPTCKQGSFRDSALISEMLQQAWRMLLFGKALHGPIWSIALDGDSK